MKVQRLTTFLWDGDAMIPRYPKIADQIYVVGETYVLEEHYERSSATHRHFFAAVSEAFTNLPEHLAQDFATPEMLRKYAVIKAGYHNHRSIVTRSKAEALRLAAFVRPMDEFAIVTVSDCVVDVFTAKSQSHRAMNRQEFAASKEAVLAILARMIDTAPVELERAGADA